MNRSNAEIAQEYGPFLELTTSMDSPMTGSTSGLHREIS